jgi:HSP20 family protein
MVLSLITPSGNGGVRSALAVNPLGFLQREVDRLFEDFIGSPKDTGPVKDTRQAQVTLVPSMDVIETDTDILIAAEMPGLQRDDVEITIADNVLKIRGEKRPEREEASDKDKKYQVSERSYGVFLRSLQLPAGIDPSAVEATMSNGVLRIRIPKPARCQPKKIEVKEAAPQRDRDGQPQASGRAAARSSQ